MSELPLPPKIGVRYVVLRVGPATVRERPVARSNTRILEAVPNVVYVSIDPLGFQAGLPPFGSVGTVISKAPSLSMMRIDGPRMYAMRVAEMPRCPVAHRSISSET